MATSDRIRRDIPALTSIRFLAAFYVVLHHTAPASVRSHPALDHFLLNGDSAVEMFFFLSGFILTYTNSGQDPVSPRRFYYLRFSRIYPVYLLGLILYFPAIFHNLTTLHASAWAVWSRIAIYGTAAGLLIQAWVPKWALAWNGPGWSLSAEAFFYALFPFALSWIRRASTKTLLLAWPVLWVWSVAPVLLYSSLPPDIQNRYWVPYLLEFNPLLRLPEFLGGMIAATFMLSMDQRRWERADAGAAIMTAIIVMTDIFASPTVGKFLFFNEFPVFLLLLALSDGVLTRLLSARLLVVLGGASYAIYIIHIPLGYFFPVAQGPVVTAQGADAGSGGLLPMQEYPFYLVALVSASVLLFKYFELPISRALRSRTQAPAANATPARI